MNDAKGEVPPVAFDAAAEEFLAHRRIAVAGVSRTRGAVANAIYRKLKAAGKTVYAVNPAAAKVEGDPCYPSLAALPERVDGVIVATPPAAALALVRECAERGIPRVWIHRSFGQGSLSDAAVTAGRELGIRVIPGGCPMMYSRPVDVGHRCMRWLLKRTGGIPGAI